MSTLEEEVHTRHKMFGFCADIGAPKSVIGRKQLSRIMTAVGVRKRKLKLSRNRFWFADTCFKSWERSIAIEKPSNVPRVYVEMDVVDADIPALLGLDVLDRERLVADTVFNGLARRVWVKKVNGRDIYIDEWFVPLVRSSSGHVYVSMDIGQHTFFSVAQLQRLHRQFYHPSAEKLFQLLRKARPEDVTPETLKVLEDLGKRCDPCQRIQTAPVRFKVSFGAEHVRFNERIMMDVMSIDGAPILPVVDEGTRFGAARFLPSVSTKCIWETILKCWATSTPECPTEYLLTKVVHSPRPSSTWQRTRV